MSIKIADMQVDYVDHLGSDVNVVNAARCSFAKEVKEFDFEKDTKLINYLAKHNHFTPLAHTSVTIRVKAPIFMARQFVKHQIGLVWNEESRRYIDDEVEFYIPKMWRPKPINAKQGSSVGEVKINTYGSGTCMRCGEIVERKSAGPVGKWCSEKCRSNHRKEFDPDFRIHSCKYNAGKRGIPFDLSRGDVHWVDKCPLLGIELNYKAGEDSYDNAPSIDRIDESKGYTKDNVWVISNKANRMKNDGSSEDLVLFAKNILKHFNGQIVAENGSVEAHCEHMANYYYELLDQGVAPEQARMVLPQNTMTNWMWTGSLVAFARVVKLRTDSHAQQEAQELAKLINDVVAPLYPVSWKALMEN